MALSGNLTTTSYDGRYYKLSWTAAQSVENNSSVISWTLSSHDGADSWYAERTLKVVIAGTTVYSKTARVERYTGNITSGTLTLAHGTDGKKSFTASVQAAVFYESVNCTGSKTFALDDIPRAASITAAPNFTDEENPTISYSNPAGSAVSKLEACISFTGALDDIRYRDVPINGSSYTFQLTEAERETLRKACTTANSMTVYFYLATTLGGTIYRKNVARTLTIVNAQPTLAPTVKDTESLTVQLTGNADSVVRYHSDVAYTIGAAARKHATIVSQRVTYAGKFSTAASGTLADVESGYFVFQVTDSRGNTATSNKALKLVEYVHITCAMEVSTPTAEGECTLRAFGNAFNGSFGATANALTVEYRASTDGGSTWGKWTAVTAVQSGNSYDAVANITGLDYRTTYTFQARARDELEMAASDSRTVKAFPLFDWGENDFTFNVPVNAADGMNVSGGLIVNGVPIGSHKELWGGGAYHMIGSHTIQLAEAVSAQAHGIVLVWGAYSGSTAYNYDWYYQFIPKHHVSKQNGTGVGAIMATAGFGYVGSKYVYVYDTYLQGNDRNNATGTSNGITYNNGYWVLRYVIGV